MLRCRFKKCPFHKACSGLPYICMWVQYIAIAALLAWVSYLFLVR